MKRTSEDLIQQALTGIREAQPDAGMEQRLLAALRQRAAAPTPLWRRAMSLPSWNWQFAAVSVVLVAAIAHFITHHRPTTITTPITSQSQLPRVVPADNTAHKAVYASNNPGGSKSSGLQRTPKSTLPDTSSTLAAADRQALDDTNAPSHPAPPMPLTAQERLLLSAARKGDPVEVAELEPAYASSLRAAAEDRKKSDIQQYAKLLLGPLALSESMNPTSASPKPDEPPPSPAPDLPASSSN
jgi:hypothetical protein